MKAIAPPFGSSGKQSIVASQCIVSQILQFAMSLLWDKIHPGQWVKVALDAVRAEQILDNAPSAKEK